MSLFSPKWEKQKTFYLRVIRTTLFWVPILCGALDCSHNDLTRELIYNIFKMNLRPEVITCCIFFVKVLFEKGRKGRFPSRN